MPPKRKNAEHGNVTIGRAKIRRGEAGKKIVEEDIRNNVLLFLEKLEDTEAQNYGEPSFQSTLNAAVSGALNPKLGPQAFIDLTTYGVEFPTVFGNKQAGQLMTKLLNTLDLNDDERLKALQRAFDEQKKELEKEQEGRGQVENTLAYLQELIPLSNAGQKSLSIDLEALGPNEDTAWLYSLMWTSCLQWMDARLRQLRSFGGHTQSKPVEPTGLKERTAIINIRMHGGDLRIDALLSSIRFGDIRHNDMAYDTFIRESFRKMYKLDVDDGLWLAKYGSEIYRGVDWPLVIGFIDKFVSISDRVHTWKGQKVPSNYADVVNLRFVPLTNFVSGLIKQADADDTWNISAKDAGTLEKLQRDLYKHTKKWIQKGETDCLWDSVGNEPNKWDHAGYLRDVTSVKTRNFQQGAAVLKLRPQARVKYQV